MLKGKRDSNALKKLGYCGKILEFHRFGGMVNFTDSVARYQRIIVLFDGDKKGRYLTGKTIQLLQRRTKWIFLSKETKRNNKGKIMFVEQLVCYESYLV